MAEIMGTVTSIKRYLSPEKIELKISPDMGPENTIILPQNYLPQYLLQRGTEGI